jgi:hypothetical protein
MTARGFLGARKTRTPEKFRRQVELELADWQEHRIKTALGMQFRQSSRVRLLRPWWMPSAVYRWLLRSIVIESKDVASR